VFQFAVTVTEWIEPIDRRRMSKSPVDW